MAQPLLHSFYSFHSIDMNKHLVYISHGVSADEARAKIRENNGVHQKDVLHISVADAANDLKIA